MQTQELEQWAEDFESFHARFADLFARQEPREQARKYLHGLLAPVGERIQRHGVDVWLINTGWSGGPYGVGERMNIGHTRAMVHAALDGVLRKMETETDPFFGLSIPLSCPDVPTQVLNPRNTWAHKSAYDEQAQQLATMFQNNFRRFAGQVSEEIAAGRQPEAATA